MSDSPRNKLDQLQENIDANADAPVIVVGIDFARDLVRLARAAEQTALWYPYEGRLCRAALASFGLGEDG